MAAAVGWIAKNVDLHIVATHHRRSPLDTVRADISNHPREIGTSPSVPHDRTAGLQDALLLPDTGLVLGRIGADVYERLAGT